jgi:hypothetical protein
MKKSKIDECIKELKENARNIKPNNVEWCRNYIKDFDPKLLKWLDKQAIKNGLGNEMRDNDLLCNCVEEIHLGQLDYLLKQEFKKNKK